ncbi:MAG: hypothetical protein JXR83_16645 [Deltaproteobacteria bacterium]|nr:hypothetical protein [Deltaproteobacteria bacterium]
MGGGGLTPWLGLLACCLSAACQQSHGPCETSSQCLSGEVCVDKICRKRCRDDGACFFGERCRLGTCLPALTPCSDSRQCRSYERCYDQSCHQLCVDAIGCRSDEQCVDGICLARPQPRLAAGHGHSCAVLAGPLVKCWGDNKYGQLGVGDLSNRGDQPGELGGSLPAVDLGGDFLPVAVTAGRSFSCALSAAGAVKCWGENGDGQLGLGDIDNRGVTRQQLGTALRAVDLGALPPVTAIAAGQSHVCALIDGGTVKCWGANSKGQLGLGDTVDRGVGPNQLGAFLPSVDLGARCLVVAIAANEQRSCAICVEGAIKCWGGNGCGELGLGDLEDRGDGPDEMGHRLPAIDLGDGRRAVALAMGAFHTCAVVDDGTVRCWGANGQGQLGLGDAVARGGEEGTMGDRLPAVALGGAPAVALSGGESHSCALLDRVGVKCWGNNGNGQLGQGDVIDRGNEVNPELGDSLQPVDVGGLQGIATIGTGWYHNCLQRVDGSIKCWGYNADGQLGIGDTLNRGEQPGQMGESLPAVNLGSL